jgi:hypothetical protein
MFSKIPENNIYFTTKDEYDEYGPDYMKEHICSNNYNYNYNFNQMQMNMSINITENNNNNQDMNYIPNKKAKFI